LHRSEHTVCQFNFLDVSMFDLADIFIFLAIGSLLVGSIGIVLLRLSRRPLSAMWFAAFGGVGLAWLCVVAARMLIPHQIGLVNWLADGRLPDALILSLDPISWPYAAALASLGLGVILTSVSRLQGVNWQAWFGVLTLEVVGLLAILAGNPVTLLVAWTAMDLGEMTIWQIQMRDSAIRRRVIALFGGRVFGSMVMIAAIVLARFQGDELVFYSISPILAPVLIVTVGLRLGVVPLLAPFLAENALRQGVGTMLRIVPAASAFVLLTRVAEVGIQQLWIPVLTGLTLIAAFYSALGWVNAPDALAGRPFWVMLTASMAVMAAVYNRPVACLAWGMASVFSAGLIFLSSIRHIYLLPIAVLAVLGISMLPYSPVWSGVTIYGAMWQSLPAWAALGASLVLLVVQACLLLGFMRHSIRQRSEIAASDRWIWLVYPLGLSLLVLGQYAIGWVTQPDPNALSLVEWIASFSVISLAVLLVWLQNQNPGWFSERSLGARWGSSIWIRFLTFHWAYNALGRISRLVERLLQLINSTLEGAGGLLWALLWLAMLFSLTVQYVQVP
jgi:hypothetical protein